MGLLADQEMPLSGDDNACAPKKYYNKDTVEVVKLCFVFFTKRCCLGVRVRWIQKLLYFAYIQPLL